MADRYIIDADVAIDFLRALPEAKNFLNGLPTPLLLSVVTVAELYAGVRDGKERRELDSFIQAFELVPMFRELAVQGGLYRRDYYKSHGTGIADAILAATAEHEKATLVTLNDKHFPMLRAVVVPYKKMKKP